MDEPLGALDRRLREHMQLELKRLHAELGMTFIYVTHDQGEALTMSDRVAVFRAGRIEQVDTPQEVYERPATRFVADFLGEINNIAGTVLARAAGPGCRCGSKLGRSSMQWQAQASRPAPRGGFDPAGAGRDVAGQTGGLNVLPGTVQDAVYFGDHAGCGPSWARVCRSRSSCSRKPARRQHRHSGGARLAGRGRPRAEGGQSH